LNAAMLKDLELRLLAWFSNCRLTAKKRQLLAPSSQSESMPSKRLSAVLLFILSFTSSCLAQENCIYRITASGCLHEPKERSLTGFVLTGTRGIYTALHGVVDATHIGAVGQQSFSALRISKVDIKHDVALLDSTELDHITLPGLNLVEFSQTVDPGKLAIIGHPFGIALLWTTELLLRKPDYVQLRTLLEADAETAAEKRGSPYYLAMMLSIQGKFLPGDSGAPVLDSNNRVIGIVNGGLRGGEADISWAIPMNSLEMEPNTEHLLDKLKSLKPDPSLFSFNPAPLPTPPPDQLSDDDKKTIDSVLDAIDRQSFSGRDNILNSSLLPDTKMIDFDKVDRIASRAWPQYQDKRSRKRGAVWTRFLELPGYYTSDLGAIADTNQDLTQAIIDYDVRLEKQFASMSDATAYARALIAYAKAKQFHGTIKEYKHGEDVTVETELHNAPMDCGLEIYSTAKGFTEFFLYKKVRVNVQ
jgi:hypothetical protein